MQVDLLKYHSSAQFQMPMLFFPRGLSTFIDTGYAPSHSRDPVMSLPEHDSVYSDTPEPHRDRTKRLLPGQPEVRTLIGRSPLSALPVVSSGGVHVVFAFVLVGGPWGVALPFAYAEGVCPNHA